MYNILYMNILQNINEKDIKKKMKLCLINFEKNINKFNIHFLDTNIISNLLIDYYNKKIFLYKLSNIFIEKNNCCRISLFDKNIKNIVKKTILSLNLDLNINEDKDDILIYIPPLTEEKRFYFVKLLKKEFELSKISIRNIRKYFKIKYKSLIRNFNYNKDKINKFNILLQKLTDLYISKLDILFYKKKNNILNI